MRRESYHDRGFVPDYTVTQAVLKRRLGITEHRMIRHIGVTGNQITIDLGIYADNRIKYHLTQEEFKEKLGIDSWHSVIMALASVWSNKIDISLYETKPEESVRIR